MKKQQQMTGLYTSRASRWSVRPGVNRHPSFLPSYLVSSRHISLWTLNAIYKTRVRVQNANMYMHMS